MFEETLIPGAKASLAILGRSGLLTNAYMAGGTAAALQLDHRISVDFDFFTEQAFVPRTFTDELSKQGSFEESQVSKGTVLGKFEGVKFSLFIYGHPLLFDPLPFESVSIADIRDVAAMKLDAISSRGAKRDFIDLYYICRTGYTLKDVFDFYDRKYGKLNSNFVHIQKSLIYFNDAEADEMPRMLKETKWKDVKRFFEREVRKIAI